MAKTRMISSATWCDEKFITLDDITRLVWFGIITTCDDQGRLQDNPLLIKAQLFPADDKSPELIKTSIDQLVSCGMVTRYTKEGKALLQINNWWEYQTPAWAAKSAYPAPDGWVDRVHVHGKGRTIISSNWECDGGYVDATLTQGSHKEGSTLPQGSEDVNDDVNVNVNGDVNGDGDGGSEQKSAAATASNDAELGEIFKVYEQEIGALTPFVREEVIDAIEHYPRDWILEAIRESAKSNARNWKYALAILKRWKAEGYKKDLRKSNPNAILNEYRQLYEEQKRKLV